jgi:hypothetical protein
MNTLNGDIRKGEDILGAGRLLNSAAFKHFGLPEPARDASQFGLLGEGEPD